MSTKPPVNPQDFLVQVDQNMPGRRLSIPKKGHPLVRQLYREIIANNVTLTSVAERAGVSKMTMLSWRTRHNPDLVTLEACFNALGYELTIKKTGAGQ